MLKQVLLLLDLWFKIFRWSDVCKNVETLKLGETREKIKIVSFVINFHAF